MQFDPDRYRHPTLAALGHCALVIIAAVLDAAVPALFIAGGVAIVVGAWDLLVWLIKADWRSTDFVVPFIAAIVWAVVAVVSHVLLKLQVLLCRRLGYRGYDLE